MRRTRVRAAQGEARAHILEGLKIALDDLDEVITLIRGEAARRSQGRPHARVRQFSEIQAQAILDMRLQRLTGLERQKILDELPGAAEDDRAPAAILASEELVLEIIVDELQAMRDRTATRAARRSSTRTRSRIEDLIADEDMVDHGHRTRLHQADAALDLPRPAPRRQGPHRHATAKRTSSSTSSWRRRTPTCWSSRTAAASTG